MMYKHSAYLLPNYLNMIIPDKVNTKNYYSLRTNENINILSSNTNIELSTFCLVYTFLKTAAVRTESITGNVSYRSSKHLNY